MIEVILGCGDSWLIAPGLDPQRLLCASCGTAQPVLVRFENATSGRIARFLGGQLTIETVEAC